MLPRKIQGAESARDQDALKGSAGDLPTRFVSQIRMKSQREHMLYLYSRRRRRWKDLLNGRRMGQGTEHRDYEAWMASGGGEKQERQKLEQSSKFKQP